MILLGLGSNMGDRLSFMQQAARGIAAAGFPVLKASSLYETEPFGVKQQPAFLNAVLQISADCTPFELLAACQKIEDDLGRERILHWGPRTIDIDVLVFDDQEIQSETLVLPHAYLARRRFVLTPIAEITDAPLLEGKNARELLRVCLDDGAVLPCQRAAKWLGDLAGK